MTRKFLLGLVAFIGWLLSPLTWWNDAFVNIPIAYISASFINRFVPRSFLAAFLISYWFTNVLGIIMMYIGAGKLAAKTFMSNKGYAVILTILVYSIIFGIVIGYDILKPF
ncbi:MAG: hypothetical protein NTV07_01480 [Candidatus Omnitrophica bacterium]|nr:hypothetical protein [Candidatus Omnitrophota bacterium]